MVNEQREIAIDLKKNKLRANLFKTKQLLLSIKFDLCHIRGVQKCKIVQFHKAHTFANAFSG